MSFNNRPNVPPKAQMFVKLVTENELRRDNVKRFYNTVKNNSAHDVLSVYSVQGPTGEPEESLMIHRINEDGKHEYEIPLNRNFTPKEIENVAMNLNNVLTEGNFIFESSTFDDNCCPYMDEEGIFLEPHIFETLATSLAERQHNHWLHERMSAGWRYGATRDDRQKTHPLIKPWNQLPEDQRAIDHSFPGFFIDLLEDFGYTIVSKEELAELTKRAQKR